VFSVGVVAIVFDEHSRVLLCHRRDMDMWDLPAGGVVNGELPTEAAIRETKEETGLSFIAERLVGVYGKTQVLNPFFVVWPNGDTRDTTA
jgi:ADP-ribose pyrophosphatase YjhB (NUDIX family)